MSRFPFAFEGRQAAIYLEEAAGVVFGSFLQIFNGLLLWGGDRALGR
jgi:hypothetical protein